ncbi:hypothetical protein LCGC14_0944360 [marine sediment metagenome]|uniref:Uncharacterized protein n=1 Tax=marine sediment metagenome TaxID=412755 RepID=A0A0F9NNU9_9ZZZZ
MYNLPEGHSLTTYIVQAGLLREITVSCYCGAKETYKIGKDVPTVGLASSKFADQHLAHLGKPPKMKYKKQKKQRIVTKDEPLNEEPPETEPVGDDDVPLEELE